VLSWLLLRGKCRHCQAPISIRYPIVEALTAVAFTITAIRFGPSASLPAELIFVAGLIALAAVDLERYLLPRAILYPTLVLVFIALLIAAAATGQWRRFGIAILCALGAFLVFFLIHFAKPAWLGFGDVRLAALLGLALGWMGPWYLFIGFLAANFLGAAIGIALIVAGKARRSTALPYGVFLAAGSLFALWLGAPIISWYSHHLTH
jgi:leader peptidase (prepilin peptidase)/N-methyltransferase